MGQLFSICLGDLCTRPTSDIETKNDQTVAATCVNHVGDITTKCCLGAGCYWGTEKYLKYDFAKSGTVDGQITNGAVGFMGPSSAKKNPTYEDVCTGVTGHVEVYDCEFTGGAAYYEAIIRFFFQFHDPTTMNKQGNDSGTQYSSVIYCYDTTQYEIASKVKAELQLLLDLNRLTCFQTKVVETDIRMVESEFFPALQKHQDYLAKNPRVSLQNSVKSSVIKITKRIRH